MLGVTGTNGKTTTAYLLRALLEREAPAGMPLWAARDGQVGDRWTRAGGRPHDARGDRPAGGSSGDARRAAIAPVRWRSPRTRSSWDERGRSLRRGDLHQPQPGPSRLPSDDGGLLPGQAPAVHAGGGRAPTQRRQRRRRLRTAAGGRARWRRTFAVDARRDYSARDMRCGSRLPLRVAHPGGRARARAADAGALQRRQRARGARGGARPRWRARRARVRARTGRTRPRALRAGAGGSGLRRARGLRPHARLARERAAARRAN